MRIALAGTGQMGTAVEVLARQRGYMVVSRFNTARPLTAASGIEALHGAEVVIDFSLPGIALQHLAQYCRWRIPAVVGTTGWYDHLEAVRREVEAHRAAVFYAPNFSLGIALLAESLHHLMPLLEQVPDYDPYLTETHHLHKADSPSGTALQLGRLLLDGLSRKSHLAVETQHRRIAPEALHVSSTRAGHVVGTHTVGFDGPYDRLTFTHEAKNRQGFADGALRAAAWLQGRSGLFTLSDLFTDWLRTGPAPLLAETPPPS